MADLVCQNEMYVYWSLILVRELQKNSVSEHLKLERSISFKLIIEVRWRKIVKIQQRSKVLVKMVIVHTCKDIKWAHKLYVPFNAL